MKRSVAPGLVIGLALVTTSGMSRADPAQTFEMQTDDGPRQVLMNPAGTGPHPTILVLHGANGSGEAIARKSGFAEAAARHGFTAVFPSGLDHRWHYGPSVHGTSADDVAFLRALIGRLVKEGVADPKRIYMAGISNGGLMTFKMLCSPGNLLAGAATIIANLPAELEGCAPPAIPYVMVNATGDPVMPFEGGRLGLRHEGGTVLGPMQSATFLAKADACRTAPGDGTPIGKTVVELTWKDCTPGTSVTFFRVEKGGHTIPGTAPAINPAFGPTNQDLQAAEAILQVFDGRP